MCKVQEQTSELQSQMQVLIDQYDSLKEENRQLEDKLLAARSQEIKERAEW
jgi:cell division protein FtsB